MLLASTFAVLRINSELQTINQLSAGTAQAAVFSPTIKFEYATQELAVAAVTAFGNPEANPALDTAIGRFDSAAADLDTELRSSTVEHAISSELTQVLASARSMRNSLRSGSVASIGEQVDAISTKIRETMSTSQTVGELRVQQLFLQVGTATVAGRMLTQERIMLATPNAGQNPAIRVRLLTTIGAELTMIESYRELNTGLAENYPIIKDSAETRIGILMQNAPDPGSIPAMQENLRASADAYGRETVNLSEALDAQLARLTTEARNNVLRDTSIVIGMLLAGLAIALVVARSLVVPVRRLRRDALQVAHIDLPQELEVVRSGGATPEITPVDVHTTEEVGQLARAVDDIHQQALHLAADQARLRLQIGNMFETLSRRSQSLVEQQLNLIEELERDEDDSERLQSLFRLDHLATRMRRNGDNLLVLAGTALRRGHLPAVPLSDMLWSSVSQVEDYQRVEIGTVPDGIVAGEPAVDIEHLLAELIDNALRYSPPSTPVAVSVARAVDGGYLIEITDRGLGMNAEDLQSINDRLASGGEVNVETARRMGLFVVGRLAKRHNITVSLRRTSAMVAQPGITASVHLPGTLVSPAPAPERTDNSTGTYPLTSALPVNPQHSGLTSLPSGQNSQQQSLTTLNAPGTPTATPAVAPPRLMPVPNPPEPAAPRFGVTSSGLPQRRASLDEPEPAQARPETEAAPSPVDFWGENQQWDNSETQQYKASDVEQWGSANGLSRQPAPVPTPVPTPAPAPEPVAAPTGSAASFGGYSNGGFENGGTDNATGAANGSTANGPAGNGNGGNGNSGGGNRSDDSNGNGNGDSGAGRTPTAPRQPAPAQGLRPVGDDIQSPIYQRMVSEWLVEPAVGGQPSAAWSSSSDAGWAAAEQAMEPATNSTTQGGLPIRRPGAQLVPGAAAPVEEEGNRNPDEIRSSLTRHLSGVLSGRADAQYKDGAPYNDGGHA
ncbi:sensor histidine kinase [Nocardia uniformis]|uniref:sensor histidine kinase n=1 Tax=Nocardia uniformis TaxID=53432 RepID=UPI001FE15E60|nr:ATP-binding protein [Nocardia uniformis]